MVQRVESKLSQFMLDCEANAVQAFTSLLGKAELSSLKTIVEELNDAGTGLAAAKIRKFSSLMFGEDLASIQVLHGQYGTIVATAADICEYAFVLACGSEQSFNLREFVAIVKTTIHYKENTALASLTEGVNRLNMLGA